MKDKQARNRSASAPKGPIHAVAIRTPLGRFAVAATDLGLCAVVPLHGRGADVRRSAELRKAIARQGMDAGRVVGHANGSRLPAALRSGAEALAAYGRGSRRAYRGPLDLGGTDFQRAVWKRLLTIQHGETVSYGAIAKAIGAPRASRAVGAAVGANPISVLIPCHRVIGASGTLTGYGGGLPMKRALLAREGWESEAGASGRVRSRG
jgi:O-6-methylguanine DNA methyltransferase